MLFRSSVLTKLGDCLSCLFDSWIAQFSYFFCYGMLVVYNIPLVGCWYRYTAHFSSFSSPSPPSSITLALSHLQKFCFLLPIFCFPLWIQFCPCPAKLLPTCGVRCTASLIVPPTFHSGCKEHYARFHILCTQWRAALCSLLCIHGSDTDAQQYQHS